MSHHKALHRATISLRSIAAGEFGRSSVCFEVKAVS
jgi:hypothetical protein